MIEPAAWAENIPFNETRDYVKKVLSNSVYYAALLGEPAAVAEARLGGADRPARAPGADARQTCHDTPDRPNPLMP